MKIFFVDLFIFAEFIITSFLLAQVYGSANFLNEICIDFAKFTL